MIHTENYKGTRDVCNACSRCRVHCTKLSQGSSCQVVSKNDSATKACAKCWAVLEALLWGSMWILTLHCFFVAPRLVLRFESFGFVSRRTDGRPPSDLLEGQRHRQC